MRGGQNLPKLLTLQVDRLIFLGPVIGGLALPESVKLTSLVPDLVFDAGTTSSGGNENLTTSLEKAFQNELAQGSDDYTLQQPTDRTSTHSPDGECQLGSCFGTWHLDRKDSRVVCSLSQHVSRLVVDLDGDTFGFESRCILGNLNLQNLGHLVHGERGENGHFVESVQEFCRESLLDHSQSILTALLGDLSAFTEPLKQDLRSHVAGKNDDAVLEADIAALAISQASIVHDLQKHIPHLRVSLLYLVTENDTVRPTSHSLGELSSLVISHVTCIRCQYDIESNKRLSGKRLRMYQEETR
mmetsp:Transcript_27284/g.42644  ORF Transcript_27284/g.42644 Transcript_27284/m.42644 type:complete len:300 (+) Transcript_27284:3005-3904(+)